MTDIRKQKEGIILVLTLILTSILLTVSISFGVLIISDIRQAKLIDDSIVAYYAADSGLERALFLLRRQEKTLAEIDKEYELDKSKSNWDIGASKEFETTFFRQRINNGESIKLFFLARNEENKANSIFLNWDKDPLSAIRMQISFTRLSLDGGDVFQTDQSEVLVTTSSKNCFEFQSDNSDYAVEIKALGSVGEYVDKLKIVGYLDGECEGEKASSSISNITLISEGKHNKSSQKIIAHIPPKNPFSGMLSFVLFSEQDITKR